MVPLLLRRFALLIALVWTMASTVFSADDPPRDWNSASPSEIHARMAQEKAAALDRGSALRQQFPVEAASAQTNYNVRFYDIFIRVDDTSTTLFGRVKFVAEALEANVGAVEVDLYGTMAIDSVTASSGSLSYTRTGNVVTVDLGADYDIGAEFEFDLWYHGDPRDGGWGAFDFTYHSGYRSIFSISEPYYARTWWPCKDRMDDKADSFHIAIEVDTAYFVGSNGRLDSTIDNGGNSHTYFYSVRYPMATYLFSVAIGPYIVWNDEWVHNGGADTMPLVHAVFPNWYTYSLTAFDITPEALSIFSEAFGPYPFDQEKYGHSLAPMGGAMEHQTMSTMNAGEFGMSTPVIVHELAHQWWGDMITCRSWHDIWLNEGWASYGEAIYQEGVGGFSAYQNYMLGMQYFGGGKVYCEDTTNSWSIFSTAVYDKGAWVVHMLRGVLGDSLFFAGVEDYYNSPYQYGSATTEQFQDVFEAVAGTDLDWFFDQWVYGAYYPKFKWAWTARPAGEGGTNIYIRVNQVQSSTPTVFTMPVELVIAGANDTATVWVDERSERLKLHTNGPFDGISFDPQHWILDSTTQMSWTMFITSLRDELRPATQYLAFADTIDILGGGSLRTWSVIDGALPGGLTITNRGIISGNPSDSGEFAFTVRVEEHYFGYSDEADFTLSVAPNLYLPGDFTDDSSANVADLTALVAYLFRAGAPPLLPNAADVNSSCNINVADVTYFVSYLFKGGPAPLRGCIL